MPPQGPLPGADDHPFGLIETFRWSREAGYDLLDEHMERLARSADALGFACRIDVVERRLASAAAALTGDARVRLVLEPDGAVNITATSLAGPPTLYRVAIAPARHRGDDPWLRHKTTRRDRYETPLAAATAAVGADEVLFLNDAGELCEGARSNLFLKRAGHLLTPPLQCGLLPGTLRARLIRLGKAREARLRMADLADGAEWFLGNSVRGLVRSTLIDG